MPRFLLSFCVALMLTGALNAQDKLTAFSEVMESLTKGQSVRVVVHYAKCRLVVDSTDTPAPNAIGGTEITTFEYFAKGAVNNKRAFVTWSETVLINHPRRGFVNNYVKFRVYDDNTVEINARYLNPATLETVMNETFYGSIDDGTNNGGVVFFAD